jgi:hypothetical protein
MVPADLVEDLGMHQDGVRVSVRVEAANNPYVTTTVVDQFI